MKNCLMNLNMHLIDTNNENHDCAFKCRCIKHLNNNDQTAEKIKISRYYGDLLNITTPESLREWQSLNIILCESIFYEKLDIYIDTDSRTSSDRKKCFIRVSNDV